MATSKSKRRKKNSPTAYPPIYQPDMSQMSLGGFFKKTGNLIKDYGIGVADFATGLVGAKNVITEDDYRTKIGKGWAGVSDVLAPVAGTVGANLIAPGVGGMAMSGLQKGVGAVDAQNAPQAPQPIPFNPAVTGNQQAYTPTFKYGGSMKRKYQTGGPMGGANGEFIDYNVGQSHNGPDEGIPVDAQGQPAATSGGKAVALTEKGEVTYNGYVFSDTTKLPGNKKRTFSDEAKRIKNKYKLYLGKDLDKKDNISESALARELEKLMMLQETVKGNTIRTEDAEAMLAEQQAMMAQQQQPQQGGSPEEQMMMEQQMMAQQGMPMMKSGGDLRSLPRGNATMKDVEYYAKKYPQEMEMGETVEYEHTGNKDLARRIAADHIKDFEKMHGGPGYYQALKDYQITDELKYGGSINIKPSKRGTFTTAAKKRGMGVQEFAGKVMSNKDNYSPAMVKKANFARNAAKWNKKQDGGGLPQFSNTLEQQQFLQSQGFNPGQLDGVMGPKTQIAWNNYMNNQLGAPQQMQSLASQALETSTAELAMPETSGLNSSGNESWQAYSGDISPWTMAPSVIGSLVGLAANKRQKDVSLGRMVPEQINLESQRVAARNRAAAARATTARRLRDTGLTPGAYLGNMQTAGSDIERNLGEQMSQSYLAEQTTNAQARQQAQAANLQMGAQETMFNRQLGDRYRQQQLGYIGNLLNVPSQYLSDLQRSRRDAAFLNMMSPDYSYQEEVSPYSTIDPRNMWRRPRYRVYANENLRRQSAG